MSFVNNIIFDLGNVIIDLDMEETDRQFAKIFGEAHLQSQKPIFQENQFFERYEMGFFTEETFVQTLQNAAISPIAPAQILDAWNAMLLTIPSRRLEMLLKLKERYRVFLLSNTNETHLRWVRGYLEKTHGIVDFDERFFHKAYYSHLVGLRKPNADIYEFVLRDAGILASETLFIDDNSYNIQGARALGIQTILHPVGAEIVDVMEAFL